MGILKKKYKQLKKSYITYKASEPQRMEAKIIRQQKYNEYQKLRAEGKKLNREIMGGGNPSGMGKKFSYDPPPVTFGSSLSKKKKGYGISVTKK